MVQSSKPSTMDRSHWTDLGNYQRNWSHRARIAARMVQQTPVSWVADVGCGRGDLSRFLPPKARYLGSDIVAWTPETEVCDLNAGVYPDRSLAVCEAVTLLGVVERIYNLPGLFAYLAPRIDYLLVTYHDAEAKWRNEEWPHAYSPGEFGEMLQAAGFTIVQCVPYKHQKLWLARSLLVSAEAAIARRGAQANFPLGLPSPWLKLVRYSNRITDTWLRW
jgi:hypothetical protein